MVEATASANTRKEMIMSCRSSLALAACLAFLLPETSFAGDSGDFEGVGIRVVEMQGESIILFTEVDETTLAVTRTFEVVLGSDSSARMNLGLEVQGVAAEEVTIEVTTGSVLLRELGAGSTTLVPSDPDVVPLTEGSYLVSAGANASLNFTFTETIPFSEGDMTIWSIQAEDSTITFHPSGDTGALWLGTSGSTGSEVTAGFRVFGGAKGKGSPVERSLVWVNQVNGTGFTMPAEGSDQVPTTFPVGDSTIVVGPNSLAAIVFDRGDDSDDGSSGTPGDMDGDGDADEVDYALLGDQLGICVGDLNLDGEVGGADVGLLLGAWGLCP